VIAALLPADRGNSTLRLSAYHIESASMEPTLHCAGQPGCRSLHSDEVLVEPLAAGRAVARWSIVALTLSKSRRATCGTGKTLIKRVIALPGETVTQGYGRLYVDGRLLNQPFLASGPGRGRDFGPTRVARGHYFVMGDNRVISCDSRAFGTVTRSEITGKVVVIKRG
jgi:signal peptidase I